MASKNGKAGPYTGITELQRRYLEGDEEALSDLYVEIVKLAKVIRHGEHYDALDDDALFDLAGRICERLMTDRKIIMTNPSGYLKHALYYLSLKVEFDPVYIADNEAEEVNFMEFEDNRELVGAKERLIRISRAITENDELRRWVAECVVGEEPMSHVAARIEDEDMREDFTRIMRTIKQALKVKNISNSKDSLWD